VLSIVLRSISAEFGLARAGKVIVRSPRLARIIWDWGLLRVSGHARFAFFIILHELLHFVGRANGHKIHDFGRGWFNEPFIAPLKAAQSGGVHRRSVFG
jgi:hypothetical protein